MKKYVKTFEEFLVENYLHESIDVNKIFAEHAKDELVNTSKNTYEKAKLCQQYGAKCALICIGKKQGNRFTPKRITLN